MSHDIFISYCRSDAVAADHIRQRLQRDGWSVFFDTLSIGAGDEFPRILNEALKASKVVLACWSPEAFSSDWCMRECQVGRLRNMLVPVAVKPFTDLDVHVQFVGTNYFDLSGSSQSDWTRALQEVRRIAGNPISARTLAPAQNQTRVLPAPSSEEASIDQEWVLIPVSRDGSMFSPDVRSTRGYTIGPKGHEYVVESYEVALAQLRTMDPPRWRRPNALGNYGLVTGVRWERVSAKQLLRSFQ